MSSILESMGVINIGNHHLRYVNFYFISGVFRLITPEEQRLSCEEIARAVLDFCGDDVDEFWAWIPTMESFSEWSGLCGEAAEVYAKWWDVDLQMLRSLVQP